MHGATLILVMLLLLLAVPLAGHLLEGFTKNPNSHRHMNIGIPVVAVFGLIVLFAVNSGIRTATASVFDNVAMTTSAHAAVYSPQPRPRHRAPVLNHRTSRSSRHHQAPVSRHHYRHV